MTNNIVKYITAIIIGSMVGFVGGFQGIAGGFYISMLLIASGVIASQRKLQGLPYWLFYFLFLSALFMNIGNLVILIFLWLYLLPFFILFLPG